MRRIKNFIKGETKGTNRTFYIESIRGRKLEPNEIPEHHAFQIRNINLIANQRSMKMLQIDESTKSKKIIGEVLLFARHFSHDSAPTLSVGFNGTLFGNADEETLKSFKNWKDFYFNRDAKGNNLKDWGNTLDLLVDLYQRKCKLALPAILTFQSQANSFGKAEIYVDMPSFEEISLELNLRNLN